MRRLVLGGAAAGAMGWGIRGQYGHETGAMIAGLLVSLVVVRLLRPGAPSAWAMRAVAFGTIGVGFGGAMTYGQTLGLSHDPALVGHVDALVWGLLGVAVKGAAWIGWFGALLGMGLGHVRYRAREIAILMLAMVAVSMLGMWLFNEPHDPGSRLLPRLYFSASWHWMPDAVDLSPRREVWGGLLTALAALLAYTGLVRRDGLAVRLGAWGLFGGALGFTVGQAIQAAHAWRRPWFTTGPLAFVDPYVNWWNTMETTFGAVMGAAIAYGAWRHRAHTAGDPIDVAVETPPSTWAGWLEWTGVGVHVLLLTLAEFTDTPVVGRYTEIPLVMGVLPLTLACAGRWSPAAIALPITMLPIAGKTVRQLVIDQATVAPLTGWLAYFVAPLALTIAAAWWIVGHAREARDARAARLSLWLATWVYFALNFAFFRYPWPWAAWTNRTLHALVFLACALVLSRVARHGTVVTTSR